MTNPHVRTLVFDHIKASLSLIPEFQAVGKVARGRTSSIPEAMLPALTLTWAEQPEPATLRPSSGPNGEDGYDRTLPLSIIVHLRDRDPELEFDRICILVEAVMGVNVEVGGLAVEALLYSSRFFVNPTTGISLLAGSLGYQIHYKTIAADPTSLAA